MTPRTDNLRGAMRSPAGAFTLIEMLLAVTLLAVVFAVVSGAITAVLGGSTRVNEAMGQDSIAGEVEDVIADDLAFMTAPTEQQPFTVKQGSSRSPSLTFYTSAGSKTAWGEVTTPIHTVTYEVQPMAGGGRGLFRGEKPLVESADVYYDAPLLLADNVTLFKVEAFDGQTWQDEWPVESGAKLPALIRVYIDIQLADGSTRQLYVESAPPIEYNMRPQQERRSSGGAEGAGADNQNNNGGTPQDKAGPGNPSDASGQPQEGAGQ